MPEPLLCRSGTMAFRTSNARDRRVCIRLHRIFFLTGKPPFVEKPELEHQKQPLPHFSCADGRLQALINNMVRKLPETRPALSRIEGLLAEIVAKPQLSTSDPLSALATVGAQVAEKEQQVQAKQAAEQS